MNYCAVYYSGLAWGLDFNPHTHPIPTEKSCGNPHRIPIPTEPRNPPYLGLYSQSHSHTMQLHISIPTAALVLLTKASSNTHWRSQDFVLRAAWEPAPRRVPDAEGDERGGELGGQVRRYPLPSRLGGLGSIVSSPSRVRSGTRFTSIYRPGRKRILVDFELEKKTNLVMTNLIFFVIFIAHI